MNGKLIVIAGIDGSGKATQTALLTERLRRRGFDVGSIEFPQYENSFFGRVVARYLRGEFGRGHEVSPYLASILYAGDRWEAKERLAAWLHAGKIVVCNRYVSANKGHQGGKIEDPDERKRFLQWLDTLEFEVFGIPRPDLVMVLHVPVDIASGLVRAKAPRSYVDGGRDTHEKDSLHQRRAQEAFLEMAAAQPNCVRIDCAPHGRLLSESEVADLVWQRIQSLLGKKE